jgi:hypothetical protein
MARWIVAGLIVLNLMLGIGVYLRLGERSAQAQIGKPAVDIATVAGQSNNNAIVYILNVATGDLVAVRPDPINNRVDLVTKTNVAADMKRVIRTP